MDMGEPISVTLFVADDEKHNEKLCPWHEEATGSAKAMDPQDGDEDAHGPMPDNSGKKLGANLANAGTPAPVGNAVSVFYRQGEVLRYPSGRKKKVVRVYEESDEEEEYDLQYAPHHLVPGNESLKGSGIVAFLGGNDIIGAFQLRGKPTSQIHDGQSAGYDVNSAKNGEWLPSPYALSMSNEWPAADGLTALRRRKGEETSLETEAFKMAYAVSAMECSPRRQFHMRHKDYSNKVREILSAMGAKVELLATLCPEVKNKDEDKHAPPGGLVSRLNALSGKLRQLLRGTPGGWRPPLFTDALAEQYFIDYKGRAKKTPDLRVL